MKFYKIENPDSVHSAEIFCPAGKTHRLIGKYRVTILGPGEINLWAEARDPYSAIKNKGKRIKTPGGAA